MPENGVMPLPARCSKWALGRLRGLAAGRGGGFLVETVVAVAIFGLVGTAVMSGLSTTHIVGARIGEQSAAETIARNQMEYVFSLAYRDPPSTYPATAAASGYSVSADAEEYVAGDPNIEKVVVRVNHESREVLVLETLRTRE